MPITIYVATTTFKEAVSGLTVTPEVKADLLKRVVEGAAQTLVNLDQNEKLLLEQLLTLKIAKVARTRISQFLAPALMAPLVQVTAGDTQKLLDTQMPDFSTYLQSVQALQGQMFETIVLGRWYPFKMPQIDEIKHGKKIIGIGVNIDFQMVRSNHHVGKRIYAQNFKQLYAGKTLKEILLHISIRLEEPPVDPQFAMSRLVPLAIGMAEDFGKQVLIRGEILEIMSDKAEDYWRHGLTWGVKKHLYESEKGIVEPELELPNTRQMGQSEMREEPDGILPFVRVFSLRSRRYIFTDVRNVTLYEYNLTLEKRLFLIPKHRRLIDNIFQVDEQTIQDLIPGKTGGIVVLGYGEPGVGKTLTAEVYAETKERPLYSLSVSEIGTTPDEIEQKLQVVFNRVERWNAVLLFDECDVFLTRRGDDVEQAAIVGMFLRLMEYYTGTLFLTTNRGTRIDPAVDSRITFRIHFPNLSTDIGAKILTDLLEEAKIQVEGDIIEVISKLKFNGRKIRNLVRALQLNRVKNLNQESFDEISEFLDMQTDTETKPA
jgi:hypothetical protein